MELEARIRALPRCARMPSVTERLQVQARFHSGGLVMTSSQLLTAVWGFAYSEATELLKPAISCLRQKVEEDPSHLTLIQTVHGIGYRLVLAPASTNLAADPDQA